MNEGMPKGIYAHNNRTIQIKSGQRYGYWTAVAEVEPVWLAGAPRRVIQCVCDCGVISNVFLKNLRSGGSTSCGCHRLTAQTKHGMYKTKTYHSWRAMLTRCNNNHHVRYDRYGGRGIAVCDEWLEFENFYRDMGERPEGKTLDRINNDANYSPRNCRWATPKEQAQNRKQRTCL